MTAPTAESLWAVLDTVMDPEVPVISVVELGIVRDVAVNGHDVVVTVTPTYSGCPATHEIEQEIVRALQRAGVAAPTVRTVFAPAWTTDWIGPAAREKLRAYGIAPPGPRTEDDDLLVALRRRETVRCPYCESPRTELRSEFGSTACKSIRFCPDCQQPFEQFKAI